MVNPGRRSTAASRMTSYDVARAAGVSQSTVSRAFDPEAPITKEMREKVIDAARKLGWQPNTIARSLQRRRTDLVGVVTAELNTPWRAMQIAALVPALQEVGMRPVLFQAPDNSDVDQVVGELASYQGRAVVIGAGQISSSLAERFASQGILVIIVNRWMPANGVLSLMCDNVEGGRMAARHLVDRGCRKLLLLRYAPSLSGADRAKGFAEDAQRLGAEVEQVAVDGMTSEAGQRAGAVLAQKIGSFDAAFCTNDAMALGVIDHGYASGAYVAGRDFALIGFDGLQEASAPAYQLTSVAQPLAETVATVADWLSRWKSGGVQVQPADSRRLRPHLLERGTTLSFSGGRA